MRMISSPLLLGAAAGLALALMAGAASADSKSVMSQCSDMYKADKAANKLPAGQTWPQYFGDCAKKMSGSDSAAATTATAKTDTASAGTSVMSQCSAQYKADKAANKVPQGQTWPKYYSACAADLKAEADATATAPEPTKASANAPLPTKDKNGKALSPGQLAFYKRERQCGQMWTADKTAGKTAGQTWPKYLSACNAKLKAAGK